MKKNEPFTERVKTASRKAFIGVGNMAVGNPPNDKSKREYIEIELFSWLGGWMYEKPMPKRRSK